MSLQVKKGDQIYNLKVVDQGNSPLKVCRNGVTYDVCLVDSGDSSASPVRVKTSAGIKAIQLQLPTQFNDDFNDNSMNTLYWQQLQAGTASCSESGQQLQVSATGGQNWSQAGYVTANSYNMANKTVTVRIASQNGVAEMELWILPNKVTNSDPYTQPNWYRIIHTNSNMVQVQRNFNNNITNLTSISASTPTTLSIAVQNGQIRFYSGGTLIYTEAYQLATYDCYVYIVTSSNVTGTGAFDNFSIAALPTDGFNDNFDDNNMNTVYWQQLQAGNASCSESGQQLQISTTDSQNWAQAGYVTTSAYNLTGKTVSVTIMPNQTVAELEMVICPNKSTTTDPYQQQPDWYRIEKRNTGIIVVQRKIGGTVQNINSYSAANQPQLSIQVLNSGIIEFYQDNTRLHYENNLLSSNCYIYIIASSNINGTGAFDNFSITPIGQQPSIQFSDNFNDNNMNTVYWQQLQAGNASCSESGQQLQISTTDSQNWAQAGYVTTSAYDISGKRVSVTIMPNQTVAELEMVICPNKSTTTDPYQQQPDWYRIAKTNTGTIVVQRKIGGTVRSLNSASASNQPQLSIQALNGTMIEFYQDNTRLHSENNLLSSNCYIYIIASSNINGTGAFDNFSIGQPQFTITASAGSGGSINPSGTTTVNQGGSQLYTINPDAGYSIQNVTVDGYSQGAISSYTYTNIQANHDIQATFTS